MVRLSHGQRELRHASGLRLKAASTRVRSACEVPPKMKGRLRRCAYSRSAKMLSEKTMILSPRTCATDVLFSQALCNMALHKLVRNATAH